MSYRRLFIMRKDLHMGAGKLAAQVGHCCEAYWTNMIKNAVEQVGRNILDPGNNLIVFTGMIPYDIYLEYVKGIFTKTICEAKNLSKLLKARDMALEMGLVEGVDFGLINDACLTDLTPEFYDENGQGRCTTGIWFKPLPDDQAHFISKHYQLYKD